MIKFAPISISNNTTINFDCKFIVNDILPIAINRSTEEVPFYTILFCCHQDIRDQYMYIQIPIIFSNEKERNAIERKKCFIDRIKENTEAYKEYVDLTINMRIENLFLSDFDYVSYPNKPYFKFQSVRQIGEFIYLRREIQITRWCWIQLMMFFDELFYDIHWNPKYFIDTKWLSSKWLKVEYFDYNAAARRQYGGRDMIINHYIVGCGPTQYSFNWITPDKYTNKLLRKSLDIKIYLAEYSTDPTIVDRIFDKSSGTLYMILPKEDHIVVLKFEPNILSESNLEDVYKNVYE